MSQTGEWPLTDPLQAPPGNTGPVPTVEQFLESLAESKLLTRSEIDAFLADHAEVLEKDTPTLVDTLVSRGLVSDHQASRLLAGQTFGLVLGNYRIVNRLGAGGMGVVYKAEHIHMKRVVALKVLAADDDRASVFLQRFYSEMEALAVLRHPNIVLAFDAGEVDVPHAPAKVLRYLVMEYVTGENLEQFVAENGPLSIAQACDYVRQTADGLRHAHEHGLVHRDIKPSNLLVTPQDEIKILDFGLARLCRRRCTEAFTMLGTVDYMAPEQARDARSVDIRADIYGLGGTLYWLLTGKKPFPDDQRSVIEELLARQRETPLPLRRHRGDIPLELEAIVCQMMAQDPNDRYPTPLALITALNAFLETSPHGSLILNRGERSPTVTNGIQTTFQDLPIHKGVEPANSTRSQRALIVSAHAEQRAAWRGAVENHGVDCFELEQADDVAEWLRRFPCDILLIDGALPGDKSGGYAAAFDLCRGLRAEPPSAPMKLVLLVEENTPAALAAAQEVGIDELLPRTVSQGELLAHIRTLLRLKEAEERADRLASHLLSTNQQLEQALRLRDADLYQAQDVLIFAMAKMAELRGLETGAHLLRMQSYVRVLAEEALRLPAFSSRIDRAFVRMLERCVLLHDIGKVAIPDHILLKPGRLEPEERSIMESHTVVGADMLDAVTHQNGACLAFLEMATDIARHHHERYDGSGYPHGLAGEAIPLAARLVTVADVYDALRSKLVYKPGLAHANARRLIHESAPGQFDPALLVAFRQCEASFEQIFEQTAD